MANRYWVTGGDGNWNSTTNWSTTSGGSSGASVPGSSDAALLNANSGSGTVTLDISPTIQTLTCTGFTGTLAFGTNTISLNSTGTIFTGATTMTVTGTPQIICTNSSSSNRTINATAVTEANSISFRITAGTGTLIFGAGSIRDIDFTDGINPTGWSGPLSTFTVTIFGSLKASTGMSVNSSANIMTFAATSGTKTINTAGVTFDRTFTFNGVGGTFRLESALTSSATRSIILTNGTLNTNSYSVTIGTFSSSNTNTRTLTLGASTVTLGNTGSSWNITDSTNMTLSAGTSSITTTGSTATMIFSGGGLTYYNVTFGATYYNTSVNGANTFNNLTVASPAAAGRRAVTFNSNQTINGTLTAVGSAANSRPRFTGATGGSTITAAAVSLSDVDFGSIIAAGASAPWSGTRFGNIGGNTNINFATPKTVYWNQPAGGNWSDVAWALTSGGAVGANNFPLPQDRAVLDNAGVGVASTIVMDYGWAFSISAGSLTNALTINWNCFGNLSASSQADVTFSSAIAITYTSGTWGVASLASLSTITTAGVSIPIATVNFNTAGNTIRLGDNFTSTGTSVGFVAGTLDLNGKTLSCVTFDSTFTDLEVRVLAFNGGQMNVTGNNATVWACENLTNFSYTGTPTVNFTYSGSTGTRVIQNGQTAGGTEANAVDFNISAGGDTVNFTAGATGSKGRNLTYQPAFTGTSEIMSGCFIYGNFLLSPSMTVSSGSSGPTFAATSGTKTITTNGATIDRPLTFNGIGGSWSLQDALTIGSTKTLGLRTGTLTTNGYSVSTGIFSASASVAVNNRTLNLGASSVTVFGTSTSTASWQFEDGIFSLTVNAGTSTIFMAEPFTGASTQNFIGGGKTYYNVVYSGGEASTIYGSNTFNSISNTTQPLALSFEAGTTQTVNNFGFSGTAGNLITMTSATPGTQWNLVKVTGSKVVVSFCSITDSNVAPTPGYWFAPTSQGNVDGGNNTGWNFGSAGNNSSFMLLM